MRDVIEEHGIEEAHADDDGKQPRVRRAHPMRREQDERTRDGEHRAGRKADDEALEFFHSCEIYALDPDDEQLEEERIGERFRERPQRRAPVERDGDGRAERHEDGAHAEQRARHIFIILDRKAICKIARQDHREAARQNLRENERVDDGRDEEAGLVARDARDGEEQLDAEHHARQQQERAGRDDCRIRVRLDVPRRRARAEQFLQFEADACHAVPCLPNASSCA